MARLGRQQPVPPIIQHGSVAPGLPISALTDDFTDGVIDTVKWPNVYGTVFETGGFGVPACTTGFSGYRSAGIYGLPESQFVALVFPPAQGGATVQAFAEIQVVAENRPTGTLLTLQVDVVTSTIIANNLVGFSEVGVAAAVAYTPGTFVWLRIRETAGTIYWESSPTGFSYDWTTIRTTATPAWVTTSAVAGVLNTHRSDGTNDFSSFDNVGLLPADPLAGPPPIVIKAQKYRPLPAGAIILREPDTRPAPSNAIGVALDGSARLPVSVRLKTATADILIQEELLDVSFSSVVPGGFASATVTLSRTPWYKVPEVALYGRMYLYDTRTGETVWEGRMEDPGRAASPEGFQWQVTAVGPSAHARDETFSSVWIDTSLDHFEKFGGSKGSTTIGTSTDASDRDGVKVAFPAGVLAASPQYVSARSLRIYNAGQALGSVRASAYSSDTSPTWEERMYVYGPSGAQLIASTTISTGITSYFGESGSDFTAGQTMLHLRMDRTGASAAPADEVSLFWYDIMVRTTLVDEEGNAVTDYSDPFVTTSQVVQDVIGRHLPLYDPLDAFIEDTTDEITQLAYDATTAYDVLNDLMAVAGAYYWAAWETIPRNGKWRFEFRPWPTTVRYEAGIEDGWDSPGSAADMYNEVLVTWKDARNRERTTLVTQAVQELTDAGLTRTAQIDLGQEIGSTSAATSAGQTFLDEHGLPSQNGRLIVARPILDYDRAQMVDPWQIRPGGLIRVRGVDARPNALNPDGRDGSTVFRIVATSFRSSDGSVELELDSDALSTSKAIARLQNRRSRR